MQHMDLGNNALLTKITACHVTTFYHVGFAYMALGRYPDAIKIFVSVLIFFNRMKQYHTRSYQYGSIAKQCERMYALLAVCTTLSPGPSDDGIMNLVKEHYGDQLSAMQSGKETAIPAFKELFLGASPKFLSPVSPPYEDHASLAAWVAEPPQDALVRQTELFLSNVQVQLGVSTMRSFLKLYTSIDATKLANFLDEDEDTVLERMMSLKSASRSYGHGQGEGSLLDGERVVTNNLDFFIDGVSDGSGGRRRCLRQLIDLETLFVLYRPIVHGSSRGDDDEPTIRWILHPKRRERQPSIRIHQERSSAHPPIGRECYHWRCQRGRCCCWTTKDGRTRGSTTNRRKAGWS